MPDAITVYSDYVCPFCYLGRESLSRYQADREDELEIDWHPFDLRANKRRPDGSIDHAVDDGKDDEYFEQARENVRRLQERYDVEMTLEIAMEVDSLPAQLVSYRVKQVEPYETWLALDEALLAALWENGRDIGDEEVLVDIATDVGLDAEVVHEALADEDLRAELTERFDAARETGVTGVPTFTYEGYAARGAVPPEQLERLVEGA
ncbi:DsbA family oxidoreductase [Haloglomus halophilum]|uniref:DsbA family oxidoreductase n=1 Tax=Haloglomus halophilum TaxID=2962672 RepID=UPI0020C9C8FC|nr:DsbA family protein [Haloglomus halophilum]